MIHIDGSFGEGGGQIIRYAVALSCLTQTPIEIINIRAKREKPGLQPQHYTAVSCIKKLCNATTTGVSIGSSKITFHPNKIQPGDYTFDIGTAGSITLVYQACILAALNTTQPITIRLTGGTDVPWSPSWDYFNYVFLKHLEHMGIKIDVSLIRRGYYPKGQGEAILTQYSIKELQPLFIETQPKFDQISGIIHIANLPDHIATRMKHTLLKKILAMDLQGSLTINQADASSPGTGITLWVHKNTIILGSSALGEKRIPAEQIANTAIHALSQEIDSLAHFDVYAFDQLLPYFFLTNKPCQGIIRTLSAHAQTTIWLLQHFFTTSIHTKQINSNTKFLIQ